MANKFTEVEFKTVYGAISKKMLESDGLFNEVIAKFKEEFDSGGYSNEQAAMALSQFYSSAYNTLESQANASSILILKSAEQELKLNAEIELIDKDVLLTQEKINSEIMNNKVDGLIDSQTADIISETENKDAAHLAQKIMSQVSELEIKTDSSSPFHIEASYGVASWEKGYDALMLLRNANQLMADAVKKGPGTILP